MGHASPIPANDPHETAKWSIQSTRKGEKERKNGRGRKKEEEKKSVSSLPSHTLPTFTGPCCAAVVRNVAPGPDRRVRQHSGPLLHAICRAAREGDVAHPCAGKGISINTHMQTYTHINTYTDTDEDSHAHRHIYTLTLTRTDTRTHMCTNTRTQTNQTHTHTHAHSLIHIHSAGRVRAV